MKQQIGADSKQRTKPDAESNPYWLEELGALNTMFKPDAHSILVVDDDPDQLAVFTMLLERAGFIVTPASTVDEAISAMENKKVDLIVSDLRMPTFDGQEFIRYLRGKKPYRNKTNVPVIILSSCDNSVELDLLRLGADMFCQKDQARKILVPQIKFLLS